MSTHAKEFGLANVIEKFRLNQKTPLLHSADLVVMSRQRSALRLLIESKLGDWKPMQEVPGMRRWTDDYSSILSILSFG